MKQKVAIVHPEIGLGGPDTVAVWILESLRDIYDVELIVCRDVDFQRINSLYGTSLNNDNIKVRVVKIPRFIEKSAKGRLLKQHILMRFCKRHAVEYDILFSTYNEMDFGRRGIQYIHFPSMDISKNARYNLMIDKWYYKDSFLRRFYVWAAARVSNYQEKNIVSNATFVNSNWTANIVKDIYGIDAITLYPPILEDFNNGKWATRSNSFIYIGIISPDKKISQMVSILKRIREKGYRVDFHIVGRIRGEGSGYPEQFRKLVEQNKEWVFYEGVLSREEMLKLISKSKFGIHAKQEHFGISIGELVKGGCIVFVPNEGGQAEIVGDAKRYVGFENEDDAVGKITSVLRDEALQRELREELIANIGKFSIEKFNDNLTSALEDFLKDSI
ncbi:MAG: glycosyltransferase [Deltaproteobacteria bacterium]|nr:glycosyltransferase [Deltaproteobacteria bacterium]